MNITMTSVPAYQIKVNDFDLGQFVKVDEWNGFIKLRNAKGEILYVVSDAGDVGFFDAFIGPLLSTSHEGKPQDINVIYGSPDLINRMKLAMETKTEDAAP